MLFICFVKKSDLLLHFHKIISNDAFFLSMLSHLDSFAHHFAYLSVAMHFDQ
jgi:hypothetical protein